MKAKKRKRATAMAQMAAKISQLSGKVEQMRRTQRSLLKVFRGQITELGQLRQVLLALRDGKL